MSKIIPKGDLDDCRAWEPPAMAGGVMQTSNNVSMLTTKQIDRIQRQAYDEGFAHGRNEGLASVKTPLEAVLRALAEPLAEFDEQAMREIALLIATTARQLVRRELKTNPDEIVAVVRETLSALPVSARHVRVHLQPEDALLVRNALSLSESERHWQIVDDPVLLRGGCRVYAEASQIDASVESRIAAIIAKMLGGERENGTQFT